MTPNTYWSQVHLKRRASTINITRTGLHSVVSLPKRFQMWHHSLRFIWVFYCVWFCFHLPTFYWEPWKTDCIFKTMVWKERKGNVRQPDGWGRSWPPSALSFLAVLPSQANPFSNFLGIPQRWVPCCQGFVERQEGGMQIGKMGLMFSTWGQKKDEEAIFGQFGSR